MITPKPIYFDILAPYKKMEGGTIQYTTCRDFGHISRYKGLRQLIHNPFEHDRFITLETSNPILTNAEFLFYDVPATEEDRIDLIAYKFLGSAQYGWVISYFNDIEDGYTVHEGQRLRIIKNFMNLFQKGELLAPIPGMQLNLGTE